MKHQDSYCRWVGDERLDVEVRRLERSTLFESVSSFGNWVVGTSRSSPKPSSPSSPRSSAPSLLECGVVFTHADEPVTGKLLPRLVDLCDRSPEHLDQVPGEFNFVRLRRDGTATVVRSCGGTSPWYVRLEAGQPAISSRLDWLSVLQAEPITFDRLAALSGLLYPAFLEPRTAITGSQIVSRGRFAEVSGRGIRHAPYWRPAPLTRSPPSRDHAEYVGLELRRLLSRSLESSLTDNESLLLFSGGLDSSLLLGLASDHGIRLHAATLLPPADDSSSARERFFVRLPGNVFLSHYRKTATAALFDRLLHVRRLCAVGGYWGLGIERVARRGHPRILTGYFADELFGVARSDEWLVATEVRRLPRLLRDQEHGQSLWRRWLNLRLGRRRPWLVPERLSPDFTLALRDEFRELVRDAKRDASHHPGFGITQVLETYDVAGAFGTTARSANAAAVMPFCQREVVELAYRTHPAELFTAGLTKTPLRIAARGVLKRPIACRSDRGTWQMRPPERRLPPTIPSPLLDWLDRDIDPGQPTARPDGRLLMLVVEKLYTSREKLKVEQAKHRLPPT